MKSTHTIFMRRALELAALGKGSVSPNPCVGCVVVKDGRIVGEGYHRFFGGPHAEIEALHKVGSKAKGSTLYVTLEPCTHWGKTPPCSPQVITSGVKHVVIAMKDPNPVVSGKGIQSLKRAGIHVDVGIEEQSARQLNRSYITWMKEKRPYVVLKMAMTLDGKIASKTNESKWISSNESRRLVHKLRAESDAVLVGVNTANHDNPSLTSHGLGRNPLRVVVDPHKKAKRKLKIFTDKQARTIVVGSPIKKVLTDLAVQNVSQVLVEGGAETAWHFVKENLVDEYYFFIAPKIIGGRTAYTPVGGEGFRKIAQARRVKILSVGRVDEDILIHAVRKH